MIHFQKTVTNCYLKFAQKEGVFPIPILVSKTKKSSKNAEISSKISKIHEKPAN